MTTVPMPADHPTPPAEDLPVLPGYEVLELLGKGGQGSVFRARQKSLNRIVAIKVLAEEHAEDRAKRRRFLAEARLQSKLHHPNILQGIDINSQEGLWYFVMEFVSGRNLHLILVDQAQVSEKQTVDIAQQVVEALGHAFERGIVHGDIKPENLVLSHDGTVKMVDFGIARLAREQKHGGKVMGTEEFMAPEVKSGKSTGDIRSDIYSFGVTLWELLTGALPPLAQCSPKAGPDVREWEPGISKATAEIVSRCLALDPKHRFQTPRELQTALEKNGDGKAAGGAAKKTASASVEASSAATSTRGVLVPVAASVVLIAVGIAMWMVFSGPDDTDDGKANVVQQPDPPNDGSNPPPPGPGPGPGPGDTPKPPPTHVKPDPPKPGTGDGPKTGPDTPTPVPVTPTKRPEVVFSPAKPTVGEGQVLSVRAQAKHLPADFQPTFKVLDGDGRDITDNMEMPKAAPDGDDPNSVVITWEAPWFRGHHPVRMFILLSQPPLQMRLPINITDRNRPPELVRAGPRLVTVKEGGESTAVAIGAKDPDGDRIKLEIIDKPKAVESTISDGRVLLRAKDLPGKQSVEPETLVVRGTDQHGGSVTTEFQVVLEDVDHPATVKWDLGDSPWKVYDELPGDTILVRGPERPHLNVKLRVADPDVPDAPFVVALPKGTSRVPGLSLKRLDDGSNRIIWRRPPRQGWGPTHVELDVVADGAVFQRMKLRIQTLRRIEPPTASSRDPLDRALDWLRRHQLKDGSFPMTNAEFELFSDDPKHGGAGSRNHRVGVAALAALAALRSGDGSPWVVKTLDYLVKQQRRDGRVGGTSSTQTYDHMIAAEALMFGWHLLGDPGLQMAAKKAVKWIVDARNSGSAGAWRYGTRSGENDTSVTVWAMRALHAARMAGFQVGEQHFHGGNAFVDSMLADDGRIGYQTEGQATVRNNSNEDRYLSKFSESLTAAGLSILVLAPGKKASDRRFRKALGLIFDAPPAWTFRSLHGSRHHEKLSFTQKRQLKNFSPVDFYYWQHATALFRNWKLRFGSNVHNKSQWRGFTQFVASRQRKQDDAKGSFDPDSPWSHTGGRSYATAMMALAMANADFDDAFVGEEIE